MASEAPPPPRASLFSRFFGHPEPGPRDVHTNDADANAMVTFMDNSVSTTKYTLLTFLPKNLFEQFQRAANIYFLIISILTALPTSAKNPASMIGTFTFVLFISALKEAYEDYQRYKNDKAINERKVKCLRQGEVVQVTWQDVAVGDMVYVAKDHSMPADLLLISSSDQEYGKCYVDTANLDGETNLKSRQALTKTKHITEVADVTKLRARVHCEAPSPDIYNFSGNIALGDDESLPLSADSILLRGCVLRNTEFAWGLVLYTGHETKMMLNSNQAPFKMSNVMHVMNRCLYMIFAFQAVLVLLNTVASVTWKNSVGARINYMGGLLKGDGQLLPGSGDGVFAFESYLTFIVAYSHLIPISLYVAMEFVKLTQKFVLDNDLEMYHAETDIPSQARTSNLVEELGQVEFVFSDKTGTLTCNKMQFVGCTIGGQSFGEGGADDLAALGMRSHLAQSTTPHKPAGAGLTSTMHQFWLLLSLCHTVVPEKLKDEEKEALDSPEGSAVAGAGAGAGVEEEKKAGRGRGKPIKAVKPGRGGGPLSPVTPPSQSRRVNSMTRIESSSPVGGAATDNHPVAYQASSPDELALVNAARDAGYIFLSRTPEEVQVEVSGRMQTFSLLATLPFDSDRKRMSVVVRDASGKVRLYTKGADNVILERLRNGQMAAPRGKTEGHLTAFSREGLRTLCLAVRDINDADWQRFSARIREAQLILDREEREGKLSAVYAEMEQGLNLLGATAIEDKLQDNVPQAIELMRQAGIRVWVLTGDKQETAINIGYSCKLLTQDMSVHRLADFAETAESLAEGIDRTTELIDTESTSGHGHHHGIVVTGAVLSMALDPKVRDRFLRLALKCEVCICCRVSPKQKAQVVHLVKDNLPVVTLAVGDGANDVSMIQAAHLGVGINGEEGTQAVRSSDYSIGQFRFLAKLLLVHGRWGYNRITVFILYYFYKNMVAALTEFFFAWYCGFSGQLFFANWLSLNYNAVYTSYPAIFAVAFEQDLSKEILMAHPQLYMSQGPARRGFGPIHFVRWIMYAFFHAAVCFFVPVLSLETAVYSSGKMAGNWFVGAVSFTCVILVVTFKMGVEVRMWTKLFLCITIISMMVYFISLVMLSSVTIASMPGLDWELVGINNMMFACPRVYFIVLLSVITALLPDYGYNFVQRNYFPSPSDDALRMQEGVLPDGKLAPAKLRKMKAGR